MISSTTATGPNLSRFGPIGLVVVQSTSLCNLDCSYCYLPDRQKKRVFDLDMLPLLMQQEELTSDVKASSDHRIDSILSGADRDGVVGRQGQAGVFREHSLSGAPPAACE